MIISRVYRFYLPLRTFVIGQKYFVHTDCVTRQSISFLSRLKAFRRRKTEVTSLESSAEVELEEDKQIESLSEYTSRDVLLPLSDVQTRLDGIVRNEFGKQLEDSSLSCSTLDITDFVIKFKIIQKCHQEFGLAVPNHKLHAMKTVHDLVEYYSSLHPEQSLPFESVDRTGLPKNLTIN